MRKWVACSSDCKIVRLQDGLRQITRGRAARSIRNRRNCENGCHCRRGGRSWGRTVPKRAHKAQRDIRRKTRVLEPAAHIAVHFLSVLLEAALKFFNFQCLRLIDMQEAMAISADHCEIRHPCQFWCLAERQLTPMMHL